MEIFGSIKAVQHRLHILRLQGNTIGLTPTMGGLHRGHMELVRTSRDQNDITVATIYVNPTQFNNPLDLINYPRSLEKDLELLESGSVDIVFTPSDQEMYPNPPQLKFDFGELDKTMEGKYRPGHFSGVGIVVTKLFNILGPDRAYFGQKDIQQLMIIRQLVRDVNFGIEIVGVPTVRENSGLAMSSRNERLSKEQRSKADIIYKGLVEGSNKIAEGYKVDDCKEAIMKIYATEPELQPEYIEFVDIDDMVLLKEINKTKSLAICTAAYLGEVRLIDNIIVEL